MHRSPRHRLALAPRGVLRLVLVGALLAAPPPAGAQVPAVEVAPTARPLADHPRVAEAVRLLETWIDGQRAYEQVPGISAAVADADGVAWSAAFGVADRDEGTPATPETVYSICSISKLFTAMAVLQLRDEGALRLSDPVAEHLPWYSIEVAHPEGPPATIWGLLTHSAGLPRESDFPYWSPPDFAFPTREQVRERLAEQETLYPAARHYQYSNLGLTLAGEIAAELSGKPYDEYVRAEILAPLGLGDTRPRMPLATEEPRLAAGYGALDRQAERHRLPPFDARGIAPAAGFSSNALDLGAFASWQLRLLDEEADEAARADAAAILSANTLREMQRVHWLDPDWETARGLGFGVYRRGGTTLVGHSGSCPGYRSTVLVDHTAGLGAAVLANASGVGVESYARRALEVLAPALQEAAGAAGTGEEADAAEETPERDLERFTGTYDLQPWAGEAAVLPWQGELAVVYLPSDDPLDAMDRLRPVDSPDGNTFRRVRDDGSLGETWVFETDEGGRAVALWQHSQRTPRIDPGAR